MRTTKKETDFDLILLFTSIVLLKGFNSPIVQAANVYINGVGAYFFIHHLILTGFSPQGKTHKQHSKCLAMFFYPSGTQVVS